MAVSAIDHGLTATRRIAGDDGATCGHGFENAARGAFAVGRQDEDITAGQRRSHISECAKVVEPMP